MSHTLRAAVLPPGGYALDVLAEALDGGPAVAFLPPDSSQRAVQDACQLLRPHELVTPDGVIAPPHPPRALDPRTAVVVYTSGSSGPAKAVALSAGALYASARASVQRLGAHDAAWLCCLPISHISGVQVLTRSLLSGKKPEMVEKFSPNVLADSRAECVSLVPTMLYRAVRDGVPLEQFHTLLVGGQALDTSLRSDLEAKGVRMVTTYGMSETAGGCVYDGSPLTGVRVRITGTGHVAIAGPTLAHAYHADLQRSREVFVDGEVISSDTGRWVDDRLEVTGRCDDVLNTGGVKVSASMVENALRTHPMIADAKVTGVPDAEWGVKIVAAAVLEVEAEKPTLSELRSYVAQRTGPASAPREITYCAHIE